MYILRVGFFFFLNYHLCTFVPQPENERIDREKLILRSDLNLILRDFNAKQGMLCLKLVLVSLHDEPTTLLKENSRYCFVCKREELHM